MNNEEKDYLCLKWGTFKGWELKSESALAFTKKPEYQDLKWSMSAITQVMTDKHKQFICELIDACNCDTICLDWEGKEVSKEEAKKYIMEYGKERDDER